jgi:hypothetical protein
VDRSERGCEDVLAPALRHAGLLRDQRSKVLVADIGRQQGDNESGKAEAAVTAALRPLTRD